MSPARVWGAPQRRQPIPRKAAPGAHRTRQGGRNRAAACRAAARPSRAGHRPAGRSAGRILAGLVETAFKALFAAYEARCLVAGAAPKTKRAVGIALDDRFDKTKGGDVAYFARPCLATVAA